jgi:adenosylmethionine-8-amino-7-oxononanoate aminotransferase
MESTIEAASLGSRPHGEPIQVFFSPPGSPRKPRIVRAEGIYMWDDAGRRYIDVSSGPIASNLGHGNARVLDAMKRQAGEAVFVFPTLFETEANAELADLLTSLAGPGLDRAFFVSGGSEATESAMKLARQYAVVKGEEKRWKVISRDPSYHGNTLGALSVTGDRRAAELFGPLMREMPKVPAPLTYRLPPNHTRESYARACAAALEDKIRAEGPETVLAFIMEPVGGLATGGLVAEDEYYELVRDVCTRHGVLLIYDEVVSGAGRTGSFLGADHWPDARPDLVILAKGIAAGYTPMGAVLAPAAMVETVAQSGGFMNLFTYCANPLSCAIGHAVLQEVIDQDLIANAAARGKELRQRLEKIAANSAILGDVRGMGLLQAIELVADKETKRQIPLDLQAPSRFQHIAMERGLAVYCRRTSGGHFGDWAMASPPLTVTTEQIDEITSGLEEALGAYEQELGSQGVLG